MRLLIKSIFLISNLFFCLGQDKLFVSFDDHPRKAFNNVCRNLELIMGKNYSRWCLSDDSYALELQWLFSFISYKILYAKTNNYEITDNIILRIPIIENWDIPIIDPQYNWCPLYSTKPTTLVQITVTGIKKDDKHQFISYGSKVNSLVSPVPNECQLRLVRNWNGAIWGSPCSSGLNIYCNNSQIVCAIPSETIKKFKNSLLGRGFLTLIQLDDVVNNISSMICNEAANFGASVFNNLKMKNEFNNLLKRVEFIPSFLPYYDYENGSTSSCIDHDQKVIKEGLNKIFSSKTNAGYNFKPIVEWNSVEIELSFKRESNEIKKEFVVISLKTTSRCECDVIATENICDPVPILLWKFIWK